MLSVIIITYNEEKYITRLLKSLKKQEYKDFEVIVSDANSTDKTVKIAKKFGCKVVKGPKRGPGFGRNLGAKAAKGEYLLFLDSDVMLDKDFISKNLKEFKDKGLGIAGCYVKPIEKTLFYRFIFSLGNLLLWLNQKIRPVSPGYGIFSKKEFHDKVKGFTNKPVFSEDGDYGRRISKIAKFGILKSRPIHVSMRRFEKHGKLKTLYIYTKVEILGMFKPQKYTKFKFRFGNF